MNTPPLTLYAKYIPEGEFYIAETAPFAGARKYTLAPETDGAPNERTRNEMSEKCKTCGVRIFDEDGQDHGVNLRDGSWVCHDSGCLVKQVGESDDTITAQASEIERLKLIIAKDNEYIAKLESDIRDDTELATNKV